LDGEVLKVHHHGLNDASSSSFLAAVNARVGMIPLAAYEFSSADPYGGVAAELAARNTDVYASDRARVLGVEPDRGRGFDITVATDSRSYEVRVARSASTLFPPGSFSVAVDIEPEGSEAP
jgi:beta-lactamase superfamily II metal-dependent hydrolase